MKFRGPLFLVGCPRSGTTLAVNLLNNIKGVQIIKGETDFLRSIYARRVALRIPPRSRKLGHLQAYLDVRSASKKTWHGTINLDRWMSELDKLDRHSYHDLYIAMMRIFASQVTPPDEGVFIGSKNPYYALYTKVLLDIFPEAKFINMIRDPRAMASSLLRVDFGPDNAVDAAVLWQEYITRTDRQETRTPDRFLSVYYEDVLSDPRAVAERICDFLGVPFDFDYPKMLRDINPNLSSFDDKELTGLDKSRMHLYREILTDEQIATIETATYETLLKHGYTESNPELAAKARACRKDTDRRRRKLRYYLAAKGFVIRHGLDPRLWRP